MTTVQSAHYWAVELLTNNAPSLHRYVPTSFTEYCNGMSKETTWGDHVTLKAASGMIETL